MSLRGKVAVVTGAGSGIGRALAVELVRRGARVAVSDVDETALDETVAALKSRGDVHSRRLDVSDRAAFSEYARTIQDHFGVVHQVYNNAGIASLVLPAVELDYKHYDRILGVNLWGVIYGTKEFLPHLIASGDGHVVNISSINGIMSQPGLSAYCTSKFAVRGFSEAVRADMIRAGHRVRVTVVHPGGVKTNIANAVVAENLSEARVAEQERRKRFYNEKAFRTTAEEAANIILDGVERGHERILVGSDAKILDLAIRFFPAQYPRVAAWLDKQAFGKT